MYNNFGQYPQYAQMPQFQMPRQNQQETSLIRVTGLDGAKAYQMPPNSTAALFDGGEDIMYIKSTDGAGFPTIRMFRFEPIETAQPTGESLQGFARVEDVDELRKEIEDVKQLIQHSKSEAKSK